MKPVMCPPSNPGPSVLKMPSPVPVAADFNGNLEFIVAATGGAGSFTRRVRNAAARGGFQPRIWVDGPYGELGLRPGDYRAVVLIAGGIGVTPMVR